MSIYRLLTKHLVVGLYITGVALALSSLSDNLRSTKVVAVPVVDREQALGIVKINNANPQTIGEVGKNLQSPTTFSAKSFRQASNSGSSRLLAEARRELQRMKSSVYSHRTAVEEARGIFNYDCSGLVNRLLKRTNPDAFQMLLAHAQSKRPKAEDYKQLIEDEQLIHSYSPWQRVNRTTDLMPGDLVVWLKPPKARSNSTGHIMIVAGPISSSPVRPNEILVPVIDSTKSPHGKTDSRYASESSGLGKGMIGLVVDQSSRPYAYYWSGGQSRKFYRTKIALARLQ